jgi:Ca-activated chloride channel family protein
MKPLITIFIALLLSSVVYGQTDKQYIRKGNKDYTKSQFSDSELSYRKAIEAEKTSTDALFNLGDALYKQQKYDEAFKKFDENFAATTDDTKKANALYNQGNALLKSQKIEESIKAYKNSLKLDPENINAKYNLAYAQDLLKKQQEQQQQQQQQSQNQNQYQKKDQGEEQKDQNDQNKDENQDQQQQQQQQQSISKEDAERLLSAIANDETKVQEKVQKDKAEKGNIRVLKNW